MDFTVQWNSPGSNTGTYKCPRRFFNGKTIWEEFGQNRAKAVIFRPIFLWVRLRGLNSLY